MLISTSFFKKSPQKRMCKVIAMCSSEVAHQQKVIVSIFN